MKEYLKPTELLKDLIPFLKKDSVQLLEQVDSVLETVWKSSPPRRNKIDEDEVSEMQEKVEVMQKNMEIIIERLKQELKEGKTAKKRFVQTYPKWRKVRKNGSEKLKEIADSLNKDRFNCNVSKLVGYSTSFVGGALCLASAALIPFTMGLTTPLAIAGGSITVAGCGTTIGTSVTEIILLKSKIGQAKNIIEEDEKYYKEMCGFLKHATELQEALAEVLNIDIMKDVIEDVQDCVKKALEIPNFSRRPFIERALNTIIRNLPRRLSEALNVMAILTIISILVGIFVLLTNTKTFIVFDCANVAMRAVVGIASFMDDSLDILRITSLFTSNATLAKDLTKAITRGALSAVGMALDVAGIALTSIDVHKGSLSPQAGKILKAAEELGNETKTIDSIYERLTTIS